MLRIHVGDFKLGRREKKVINDVLDSGRLSEGPRVRDFEEKWARFIGTRYCVAVNSGTSALIAGLHALKLAHGIKDGARVITSPLTFIATVNAIAASGLEPVFADVDSRTFVVTPESIREALKRYPDIAVILPVHLMGYPVDMLKVNQLAREYGAVVMEDAAQAHGTRYKNRKLGTFSRLACFSFYIAHNIQAGEMGAVVTDDRELYRLIKKIKAHGRMCDCPVCERSRGKCPKLASYRGDDDFDPRFYHDMFGFNFKAMEFQAALGLVQLEKADQILRRRQFNVRYLNAGLSCLSDMLQLPQYSDQISYLAYPLLIRKPGLFPRKRMRGELEAAGIETRPLFGCIPTQQPAYGHLRNEYAGRLPNAENLGRNGFYIGCHQYLRKKELDYIIRIFKKIVKES